METNGIWCEPYAYKLYLYSINICSYLTSKLICSEPFTSKKVFSVVRNTRSIEGKVINSLWSMTVKMEKWNYLAVPELPGFVTGCVLDFFLFSLDKFIIWVWNTYRRVSEDTSSEFFDERNFSPIHFFCLYYVMSLLYVFSFTVSFSYHFLAE